MDLYQLAGQMEAHWHTYLHVVPGINLVALVVVIVGLVWVGKQTLKNRFKIMELELESRSKSEEGLQKILNKLDDFKKD